MKNCEICGHAISQYNNKGVADVCHACWTSDADAHMWLRFLDDDQVHVWFTEDADEEILVAVKQVVKITLRRRSLALLRELSARGHKDEGFELDLLHMITDDLTNAIAHGVATRESVNASA